MFRDFWIYFYTSWTTMIKWLKQIICIRLYMIYMYILYLSSNFIKIKLWSDSVALSLSKCSIRKHLGNHQEMEVTNFIYWSLISRRYEGNLTVIKHSFIKSWFFGMQQFSFNPAGIFSLKDTLKIYKGKKNKRNPQALGFIIESPL